MIVNPVNVGRLDIKIKKTKQKKPENTMIFFL